MLYNLHNAVIAVRSFEQTAISQNIFQMPFTDNLSAGGKSDYSAGVSAGASAGASAEGSSDGNSGAGAAISIFSV